MSNLKHELQHRILVLDGAMGTMLQQYHFTEKDFRGYRFKDYPSSLQGNNDLLSLTHDEAYLNQLVFLATNLRHIH